MNEFFVELKIKGDLALHIWDDIEKRVPGAKIHRVIQIREPGEAGQLPVVRINDKKYFQDDRLKQFRSVEEFPNKIEFIDYP